MSEPEVVEIRVHGVSGTPPEDLLDCPLVTQEAGDRNAGFSNDSAYIDLAKRLDCPLITCDVKLTTGSGTTRCVRPRRITTNQAKTA